MTTRDELRDQFKKTVDAANALLAERHADQIRCAFGPLDPALVTAMRKEAKWTGAEESAVISLDGYSYEGYLRPGSEESPLAAVVISRDIETRYFFEKDMPIPLLVRLLNCQDGDSRWRLAPDGDGGELHCVCVTLPLLEGCLSGLTLLLALNSVLQTQLALEKVLAEWSKPAAVVQIDESAN